MPYSRTRVPAALVAGLLAAAAACEETSVVVVEVADVAVTPPTTSMRIGESRQLQAAPRDDRGTPLTGRQVSWSSDNNSVASVDAGGLVTGTGVGTTTIRAVIEGRQGSAVVTVDAGPPTAVTDPPSAVGPGSATINGTVNGNGAPVQVWFELSLTSTFASLVSTDTGTAGAAVSTWSGEFEGLRGSTTYYYRIAAANQAGTTRGAARSFTTLPPAPPSVTTHAASDVGPGFAVVSGDVDANGADVAVRFEFGTSPGLATFDTTAAEALGLGSSSREETIVSLRGITTYYYRMVAANSAGVTRGNILSFTTLPPAPPTAVTIAADSITSTGAVVRGVVDPNGADTEVWFEYGTNSSLTTYSMSGTGQAGIVISVWRFTPSTLTPNTTYYYRFVASNALGTTRGAILNFTTASSSGAAAAAAAETLTGTPLAGRAFGAAPHVQRSAAAAPVARLRLREARQAPPRRRR